MNADKEDFIECPACGCSERFDTYEDLDLHLNVGKHKTSLQSETLYDQLRMQWASKLQAMDASHSLSSQQSYMATHKTNDSYEQTMGWALHKPKSGSKRFSNNVRVYLIAKFDMGEKTGRKASPTDVEAEMRIARDENNQRRFSRSEWLTANQIKSFFSRLASARKKKQNCLTPFEEMEDHDNDAMDDQVEDILDQLGLQHPIMYDVHNLCDIYSKGNLNLFNITVLKDICRFFEIPIN